MAESFLIPTVKNHTFFSKTKSGLDVLVNNVGILPTEYRAEGREMPVEHFKHVLNVNLCGPFEMTQVRQFSQPKNKMKNEIFF